MKKLIIYLGIIVALFGVLFFLNHQSNQALERQYGDNPYGKSVRQLNPATVKQLGDPNYQNIIVPKQLEEKIKNKENFFVYFFSPTCPHCEYTTPRLNPIANELNVKLEQFNLLEFPEGWQKYNIQYTPTLVYYREGKEVERMVGGLKEPNTSDGYSENEFRQFLSKYK
jgi:thiol-disulfide isomerase/thioredoxin